jgi:hypothetical protein
MVKYAKSNYELWRFRLADMAGSGIVVGSLGLTHSKACRLRDKMNKIAPDDVCYMVFRRAYKGELLVVA